MYLNDLGPELLGAALHLHKNGDPDVGFMEISNKTGSGNSFQRIAFVGRDYSR